MDPEDRTTSMNVSLPGSLRAFVDDQVSAEGYSSASEFVRELIRKARQKHDAQANLEQLLVEGINSGPAAEWTDKDWEGLRARVTQRLDSKKKTG